MTCCPKLDAGTKRLRRTEQALAIEEPLVKANPTITQYQDFLAIHYAGIGLVLSRKGHRDEAVAAFRRVVDVREALARANPTVPGYQSTWAGELNNLGNRLFEAGRNAEALAAYRRALEIEEPVAKANPEVFQYQNYLATHHGNIGKVLVRTGHASEANASYGRARSQSGSVSRRPTQIMETSSSKRWSRRWTLAFASGTTLTHPAAWRCAAKHASSSDES